MLTYVVYFDQQTGAPHAVRWSKSTLYFVIFAVKTRESFEKVDFDQRTACGAPVRWSKYTTLENLQIFWGSSRSYNRSHVVIGQ